MAVAALALRDSSGGLAGVRANAVGIIDAGSNAIVGEVPVGIRPGPIAAGEGSIWVGNLEDRTLTRIDSAQRSAVDTVSLDNKTPTGLDVGAGGVWVGHGMSGQVSRVDEQFNRVTSSIDVATRTARTGVVAVGDGSVWAAFGDSTIAQIDPTDARVAASAFTGGVSSAIVVGSGAVWVANSGESTVERFNPATFEEGAVRAFGVGRRPTGIAFGEGAVWVANTGDDSVTRIDVASGAARTIGVGRGPTAVAVGSGAVWVANTADATVSRVDPATNEVVETIEIGNAPYGVVVGDGFVWVAVQAP